MSYAEGTKVERGQSLAEIERTLTRYGATGFMYGWEGERAMVRFAADDRRVRFELQMPDPQAAEFYRTETGRPRKATAARAQWEQECRRRWRALGLVIKAKLEAVESGITTFDEEFLSHIELPDGRTVAQHALPGLARALAGGPVRLMLPGGGDQ